MKTIPAALQAHLDTRATTLCTCWRVTRADAVVLGFTDHDRDLTFESVIFKAATGFTPSAIESGLQLSVPNQDISGALASAAITEADLIAGRYDDAAVEVFRVNWADVAQRVLIAKGALGEIKRGGLAFTAEFRGLAHRLQHPLGRIYQFACDAVLGDARCTVDLDLASFKGTGAVTAASDRRRFTASGLSAFATDWFAGGQITWTSGANAGLKSAVKSFSAGTAASVSLWEPMPNAIAAADGLTMTAGCDKRFATCKAKFSNAVNFRGHPFMPGNDWVVSYPRSGDVNDGGRLG